MTPAPARHALRPEEVADLLRPVPRLGLPRPDYGGRSIANLGPSVARALGVDGSSADVPMAPPLEPGIDPFGGGRAEGPIVVFLVDGFGWNLIEDWSEGGDEHARAWASLARPITTVFPSTTTAALTSLSSGTPPGRHGLVGYRQFLPRYGVVADMLRMSPLGAPTPDLLIGPNWTPRDLSGAPTIFRRGVPGLAVSRDRFAGSGFTRLLYDGAPYSPYATLADFAHELTRWLSREDAPGVIYAYWDELDTIQHLRGMDGALAAFELDRVAQLVEYVRAHVPAKRRASTTLLVTGDHGQVPASPEGRIAVETLPSVVRELAHPPTGDRRAGFFAARPGRVDGLGEALRAVAPAGSTILPMDVAREEGLFGPPPFHPELAARLGDLLVLVPPPASLTYLAPGASPPARYLLGAHGGLDPAEIVVPLVAGRLDAFAPHPSSRTAGGPQR